MLPRGCARGLAVLALAALAAPRAEAVGVATASVDLGNEWLKIGLVKPGVPMDIVLNTESKRKTRVVIGLKDKERTFSDPAMVVAAKHPKYAFMYLTDLLGVPADSDVVQEYLKRFPHHRIEPHPERGTVVFLLDDEKYTVEELLAQILEHAVTNAAKFAEQEIAGVVITVPPYFNQAQRKALLLVGRIANINILQLINANTAVGINYGVFRSKSFNKTATNILFYDMGATSTIATVASYSTVKEKSQTSKGRTPQLEIKGIGYDRTLGGNAWDLRLRSHLLQEFMKNKKVKGRDVAGDARAMEKLFACAEKAKRVLSANKETRAQVEGLYDEIDFKTMVTRDEFEGMTEDLFARVAKPIHDALDNANLTKDDIEQIILFGGGLRIPKVQDILKETMGVDQLGRSINGDEAACLGASYRAAVLSKAFRVSKFLIKDINLYPIEMHYNKTTKEGTVKQYTEKIFPRNHPTTKSKVLLFNRSDDDFHFRLDYGDLSFLTPAERSSFAGQRLSEHNLTGLADTLAGHENDVRKGVRVKFTLDDSGVVVFAGGEVVYEREPEPEPEQKSTLESLTDYLFGGGDAGNGTNATNATAPGEGNETAAATEEGDGKGKKADGEGKKAEGAGDDGAKADEQAKEGGDGDKSDGKKEEKKEKTDKKEKADKKENKKKAKKADKKDKKADKEDRKEETKDKKDKTEDKAKDTASDKGKKEDTKKADADGGNADGGNADGGNADGGNADGGNATNATAGSADGDGDDADKAAKPKAIKIPVKVPHSSAYVDIPDATDEFVSEAQARILALVTLETERREREAAYNSLEGGIYKARDELSTDEFVAVSTEEQREAMMANLTEIGEWLDEDGWEANATVLNVKIKAVEGTMKSVRLRAAEAVDRPAAIANLRELLNTTSVFHARLVNYSNHLKENETEWHTKKELDELETLHNETLAWLDEKEAAQNATAAHETPAVFSRHINANGDKLYRELSYLSKRPKPKPKKKKVTVAKGANATNATNATNSSEKIVVDGVDIDVDVDGESAGSGGGDGDGGEGGDGEGAGDGANENEATGDDGKEDGTATDGGDDGGADGGADDADADADADAGDATDGDAEAGDADGGDDSKDGGEDEEEDAEKDEL